MDTRSNVTKAVVMDTAPITALEVGVILGANPIHLENTVGFADLNSLNIKVTAAHPTADLTKARF